jgi:hypothetical protein
MMDIKCIWFMHKLYGQSTRADQNVFTIIFAVLSEMDKTQDEIE